MKTTVRKIEKILSKKVSEDFIVKEGFIINEVNPRYCDRNSDVRNESFGFNVRVVGGNIYVQFSYTKCEFEIESLWLEFKNELGYSNYIQNHFFTINLSQGTFQEFNDKNTIEGLLVHSDRLNELETTYKELTSLFLIPSIKKFENIIELDTLLNSNVEINDKILNSTDFKGVPFRKMIVAKLANNIKYEEVCDAMKKYCQDKFELGQKHDKEHFKNYPVVFDKVYEKLKSIDPIV